MYIDFYQIILILDNKFLNAYKKQSAFLSEYLKKLTNKFLS